MPEVAATRTSPSSLFANIATKPGIVEVKLVGPSIGQREVPIITELVDAALTEKGAGLESLVLDLSQVTFMNSMALGMCVVFRNRADQVKAKVIITGMNADLRSLFKMVKFDKLFTIA